MGQQGQLFWCAMCHSLLCSYVGFLGILFFRCHALLIAVLIAFFRIRKETLGMGFLGSRKNFFFFQGSFSFKRKRGLNPY